MKDKIKSGIIVLAGITLVSIAISMFFVPNKIVNGGTSGLSTIIYYTIGLKPSIANAIINGILLIFAFFCFGKKFVTKTLLSIVLLAILTEVFSYFPPVTDNTLLAAIFGSVLYGIGIGTVLSQGSTTGGTDIMGRLIQHVRPHWKIGKVLLGVDFFIVFLSLITFKTTEAVLYGIIALFISTYSIDWLMKTLNISKLAFVITDKGVDISVYLISTSPRGVTLVNGTGAYTQKDRQILICALKDSEIPEFQRKILSLDENAFIIYSESQQIVGKGFYIYG